MTSLVDLPKGSCISSEADGELAVYRNPKGYIRIRGILNLVRVQESEVIIRQYGSHTLRAHILSSSVD